MPPDTEPQPGVPPVEPTPPVAAPAAETVTAPVAEPVTPAHQTIAQTILAELPALEELGVEKLESLTLNFLLHLTSELAAKVAHQDTVASKNVITDALNPGNK